MLSLLRILTFSAMTSLLSFGILSGQNIDSLINVADTATGKNKINVTIDIAKYYYSRNPVLALEYTNKLKSTPEEYAKDTSIQIDILSAIGDAHYWLDNMAESLDYGLQVLHLQEKLKDSAGISKTLNNIAVIYSQQGKLEKALEILKKSLEIRKKIGDEELIASNYNNLGQIYYKLEKDSIAMEYFQRSLAIHKRNNNYELLINGYNNVAVIYLREKKYSAAIANLTKSLDISDSLKMIRQKPTILFNLGEIFDKTGEIDKSIYWYLKAYEIAKEIQNFNQQLLITEKLKELYIKEKKYKLALDYSLLVSEIKDTINQRNTDAKIEHLEHQYNAKEQELKIKNLQNLNEIDSAKNQSRINLLIILALLAISIIVLLINRYTQRSKHNKRLRYEVEYRTKSLVREINERKRLQNESIELNSRFANIFHQSPMAIVSLFADGKIQLANKAFLQIVGLDPNKIKSIALSDIIINEDFNQKLNDALNGEKRSFEGEIFINNNSKSLSIKAYFNYYDLEELNIKGVFVTIEDISKQLHAIKEAQLSKMQFEELADQLPEMLIETDLEGNILFANKLALEKFGFTKQDVETNFSVFNLLLEEDRKLIIKRFQEFKEKNKKHSSREYNVQTREGKKYRIIISVNIVYLDGVPQKIRGLLVDVSERRKYEEELIKAKEKAIEADKLKSKFLQNLSHEIRTPMNGILGFSELIKNEEMSEKERKSYIDFIINASNQLLNIIDDVVNISRIESGEIKITESEISLQQLFNNLMVFFHGYLMNRNDKVSLRLKNKTGELYDNVLIAEKQVQHVLSNLLYNAIRFTKDGHIEIGVEKINDQLRFYVKDTGIGISAAEQQKIFDRFYQVNSDGTKSYGGTGLGLTIAKALVELLGGKIGVQSEINSGSEFFFTVPYKGVKAKKVESFSIPERKIMYPDWSQYFILIVEDDLNNFLFIEQLLKKTQTNLHHGRKWRRSC
jgi:PAS domain S-box-containing protein